MSHNFPEIFWGRLL